METKLWLEAWNFPPHSHPLRTGDWVYDWAWPHNEASMKIPKEWVSGSFQTGTCGGAGRVVFPEGRGKPSTSSHIPWPVYFFHLAVHLYPWLYNKLADVCVPLTYMSCSSNLWNSRRGSQEPRFIAQSIRRRAALVTQQRIRCNAGDLGSIPGLGRAPGEGKGCPLPQTIIHGVAKRRTRLSNFHFHFLSIRRQPEMCHWGLKLRQSCETESFPQRKGCHLQADNVRTELNCETHIWCCRNACCVENPHIQCQTWSVVVIWESRK